MKSVCFYFQIHQPYRLKKYRFFDIGNDHYYYDDFANDDIITHIAERSYIPMAHTLLQMIEQSNGEFRCAISITGTAVEQLQQYVPEFIELLKKLAKTGCVEFLSETYSHSLAALTEPYEFIRQVRAHDKLIHELFGQEPKIFRNTELIYDDEIASIISAMGFKGALTEGAKHILGWKSPDFMYCAASAPKLKLLLKNDKLSDAISRNFSNSEFQPGESGIFEFMKALPHFAAEKGISFITPSDAVLKLKPVDSLSVPYPMSWADEARDVSAWKGNNLQKEALAKLYSVTERVNLCSDRRLKQDWEYLQSSDHFFYMSTKNLADGTVHASFSPYESPYSAFTNYMNVLADFLVRVEEQYPIDIENEELNSLILTIRNQAQEIETLNKEVKQLRNNILEADDDENEPRHSKTKKVKDTRNYKKKTTIR